MTWKAKTHKISSWWSICDLSTSSKFLK